MGREVRRVPANWKHPKTDSAGYKPLHGDYEGSAFDFLKRANEKGLQDALDYFGRAPDQKDYMPAWTDAEATHLMMYEDTSEGTPISPAFATAEELARWLADNKASAFGEMTATYEDWLAMIGKGWAPSAVIVGGKMTSGVTGL